jgi:SAM-dependent methyltransferase
MAYGEGGAMPSHGASEEAKLRLTIREGYGRIARRGEAATEGPDGPRRSCSCCGDERAGLLAARLGYAAEDVGSLPEGANMGLSCGNPTALAQLREGETLVDLGSGGGFDCFVAGPRLGPRGRAIGVDMTAEMLQRAREGLQTYRRQTGLDNVEFRLGEIEHLPIADRVADVVLSNCVLNLSAAKAQVWREIARILKPGGRIAISDIALLKALPSAVLERAEHWVGCVAGAVPVEETRSMMSAAGLVDIEVQPRPEYVSMLERLRDPLYRELAELLPAGETVADYLTSVDVTARMPGGDLRAD